MILMEPAAEYSRQKTVTEANARQSKESSRKSVTHKMMPSVIVILK